MDALSGEQGNGGSGVKERTSEWKFLPKETAAPTTPPKLKMDQKMPMNLPF
jgi:hypothetical protein